MKTQTNKKSALALDGLTHISLASLLWDIGKSVEPDQMPQNVESDQVLHPLLRI